jgi:hypothetical protein
MKIFVVLAVSIVLVSILFCPMVMSAPSMPADLQMVQPDPSLPKELAAFWGKWEGRDNFTEYFLIVEKINEQKANLYWWQAVGVETYPAGWKRFEGNVIKERGKYKVWYRGPGGTTELTLKGEYLDSSSHSWPGDVRLKRVP